MPKSFSSLRLAAGVLALAAAGLAFYHKDSLHGLLSGSRGASAPAGAPAPPSMKPFMTAAGPEARAALVTGGGRWLEELAERYREGDPDNLSPGSFVEGSEGPEDGPLGAVRTLTAFPGRGLPPVFAGFRQEGGQGPWLLDWPLYHQTLTDAVARFAALPAAGETVLRVRLSRSAAEADKGTICASEPFQPRTALYLSAARPDLTDLLDRELPAGAAARPATVVAAWVHPADGGPLQAVLRRHVCWGFEGLNQVPAAPAAPSAEALALAKAAAALGTHRPPSGLSTGASPGMVQERAENPAMAGN